MNTAIKIKYREWYHPTLEKLVKTRSIINYEHLDKVLQAKRKLIK